MTTGAFFSIIFIGVLISVPFFIIITVFSISYYLDIKYTKEWEQNNPDSIALLKQYDKELKELEPQVRQYHSTKDAIEKLLKELDYHYDNTEPKAILEKLRKDFDQLEKIKQEQSLKLACRNAIAEEWRRYVEKKIPKWLQ